MLSVTLISNLDKLQSLVDELKREPLPYRGTIILGGQALFQDGVQVPIKGVDFCSKNLEELKSFLKGLGL